MGSKIIMNKDILKNIIEYGTKAPSGDNSQPWIFNIFGDDTICLYNVPDRDNPILNVHEGGSLVSHGAVILNIKIASEHLGYKSIVSYFPDISDKNLVAKITFIKNMNDNISYDSNFVNSIGERCTNRNYYNKNLSDNIKNELYNITGQDDLRIRLFHDENDKNFISSIISLSEEIILQTKELHALLFGDVAWTKKEESIMKHGLYVKTLEFNPIQYFVFWLCRKWKNISFLNKKIGFAHIVGKQNSDIYKSSGMLGFIIIPNTDRVTYVKAGELLQYIWLKSTNMGLGFQPITGLFFLNERIKIFGSDPISDTNSKIITDGYGNLKDFMKLYETDIILTSFRIGISKKTSARSSRLEPNIILK